MMSLLAWWAYGVGDPRPGFVQNGKGFGPLDRIRGYGWHDRRHETAEEKATRRSVCKVCFV
jgi:hypothetical protein